MRLGLDVVTEDAVSIPLRRVLKIVVTVWMKEGAVETHPPLVDQIISEWQASVLVLLFGEVLFNTS